MSLLHKAVHTNICHIEVHLDTQHLLPIAGQNNTTDIWSNRYCCSINICYPTCASGCQLSPYGLHTECNLEQNEIHCHGDVALWAHRFQNGARGFWQRAAVHMHIPGRVSLSFCPVRQTGDMPLLRFWHTFGEYHYI